MKNARMVMEDETVCYHLECDSPSSRGFDHWRCSKHSKDITDMGSVMGFCWYYERDKNCYIEFLTKNGIL